MWASLVKDAVTNPYGASQLEVSKLQWRHKDIFSLTSIHCWGACEAGAYLEASSFLYKCVPCPERSSSMYHWSMLTCWWKRSDRRSLLWVPRTLSLLRHLKYSVGKSSIHDGRISNMLRLIDFAGSIIWLSVISDFDAKDLFRYLTVTGSKDQLYSNRRKIHLEKPQAMTVV